MPDPRVKPLTDAAIKAMIDNNYDPHFSSVAERAFNETILFLARYDALMDCPGRMRVSGAQAIVEPAPIDMILFCPHCGTQHIDAPEPGNSWDNPPHRSHLCASCNHVWRPADVATCGVAEIKTKGSRDAEPIRGRM